MANSQEVLDKLCPPDTTETLQTIGLQTEVTGTTLKGFWEEFALSVQTLGASKQAQGAFGDLLLVNALTSQIYPWSLQRTFKQLDANCHVIRQTIFHFSHVAFL